MTVTEINIKKQFGLEQRGVITFGGGLNRAHAVKVAEENGYFVLVPFGGNHAELYKQRYYAEEIIQ